MRRWPGRRAACENPPGTTGDCPCRHASGRSGVAGILGSEHTLRQLAVTRTGVPGDMLPSCDMDNSEKEDFAAFRAARKYPCKAACPRPMRPSLFTSLLKEICNVQSESKTVVLLLLFKSVDEREECVPRGGPSRFRALADTTTLPSGCSVHPQSSASRDRASAPDSPATTYCNSKYVRAALGTRNAISPWQLMSSACISVLWRSRSG